MQTRSIQSQPAMKPNHLLFNECMYVCMYVCMYYVCMYACMYVCMYVYLCVYTIILYIYTYLYRVYIMYSCAHAERIIDAKDMAASLSSLRLSGACPSVFVSSSTDPVLHQENLDPYSKIMSSWCPSAFTALHK